MSQLTLRRFRDSDTPAHPAPTAKPGVRYAAALALRLACAGLLAWVGAVHLHLWLEGYRHIPTDGPLFLLDGIAGFVAAMVLLACPRRIVGLAAAGYTGSTLGALVVSINVGLFGFKESLSASYALESVVLESLATAGLLAWTLLMPIGRRAGVTLRLDARSDRAPDGA